MGYGGTSHVDVDIQTDVEAIIDGLCGSERRTLSDIENSLDYLELYLSGGMPSVLHDGYRQAVNYLEGIEISLDYLESCLGAGTPSTLYDGSRTAVSYLNGIEYRLDDLNDFLEGWTPSVLHDGRCSAVDYLGDIESSLRHDNVSIATLLHDIYIIFADVWDSQNHCLRTTSI